MMAEREIYSRAQLDDEKGVAEQLSKLKLTKDKNHLIHDYMDSIGTILTGFLNDSDTEEEQFAGSIQPGDTTTPSPTNTQNTVPSWAKGLYNKDALDMVRLSTTHYMGTVIINKKLIHAMIDTCGARSMMDKDTALELGFDIEIATKEKHFGSFYGPGNKTIHYYGRIRGPVTIKFDKDVALVAPEIKIVEHSEPLVLIGTDVLTDYTEGEWQFAYVGLHPEDRKGKLVVINK